MNDRETRRYDMFGREKTFGQTNNTDFAPTSEAAKHFANLNLIITGLDKAKAAQTGGGVTAKSVLLDVLRLDVQNVTRTARALDQDNPGLADQFPVPASASDHDLLTCADSILSQLAIDPADDAAAKAAKTALTAKFVAHELPADFVTRLQTDRTAIDNADDDVESDDEEGVSSTSAVGRLIKAGMKESNYLDAIMHNKYTFDADKLRAWQSASHIERAPQHAKPAPAPTPTSATKTT